MTNTYPGQGLSIGTAILGNTVGQAYPSGTELVFCKIYGKILTPDGDPVGEAGKTLVGSPPVLTDTWKGVSVKAKLAASALSNGAVISIEKVETTTNEYGYFEIYVIQGLTVILTCAVLSTLAPINTTGQTSIDISTLI